MFSFYFQNYLVQIIFCLSLINAFSAFTVEELRGLNYEVDISITPVKKEETNDPSMIIKSKTGQEFRCLLPQSQEEESSEKEAVNERNTDVLELLKPMKTSACLSKAKDWWTYEFCFGHYIKQFHVEDGEIIGQVITLGLYDSDYDWNNETEQDKFKLSKQKYHSQYYTNGSKCDLTGQSRNAEVRIYCEEDAGDYIYRVDEPATCSYIITIHTSRLCSHPLLKSLPSSKAHAITCNPVFTEEQYSLYMKGLKEEKAQIEEKQKQWLIDQQERLQAMKNGNIIPTDEKTEELSPKEPKPVKSAKENYETIRAILIKEKNKEMEKVKTVLPAEQYAAVKEDIQKQFDAILNEVKEDFDSGNLNGESGVINMDVVKFGLNLLSEKLDKAVKDAIRAQEKLNKARSVISDTTTDPEDLDDANLKKVLEEKMNAQNKDSLKDASNDQSRTAVLDDDKLQVRIRRLDRKSSDTSGKLHEMDFDQRKKLEQAVKEKLEKAGLDTGGRRIEVKIITAGYYDNEDGKDFEFLTDEETDQFQNMIMALLTGQQEAVQEMKRHKKLEQNYQFSWSDIEESFNKED